MVRVAGQSPVVQSPTPDDSQPIIFPRRKAGQSKKSGGKAGVVVTLEILEQCFDMPLHRACKALGVCATAFKKVCRKLGVMKWPYKDSHMPPKKESGSSRRRAQPQAQAQPLRLSPRALSERSTPRGSHSPASHCESPEETMFDPIEQEPANARSPEMHEDDVEEDLLPEVTKDVNENLCENVIDKAVTDEAPQDVEDQDLPDVDEYAVWDDFGSPSSASDEDDAGNHSEYQPNWQNSDEPTEDDIGLFAQSILKENEDTPIVKQATNYAAAEEYFTFAEAEESYDLFSLKDSWQNAHAPTMSEIFGR